MMILVDVADAMALALANVVAVAVAIAVATNVPRKRLIPGKLYNDFHPFHHVL